MKIADWISVALLLVVSAFFSSQAMNARKKADPLPMPFSQKSPENLTRFSLVGALGGARRVAADWAYIEQLQYISRPDHGDLSFERYYLWGQEILWLDPHFKHAVLENASVLGFVLGDMTRSIEYLGQAIAVIPGENRYKEMLAALVYQKEDKPNEAISVLKKEILRGEASEMLMRIVGHIYIKYEDWESAGTYWRWMCARVKEDYTLHQCQKTLALIKSKGH